MLISLIAAMGRGRVIGLDNQLPWWLPADMRRFRVMTMGKPIVMGRKTHQSIGKSLPGRTNLVLSRDPALEIEDCLVVHSLDEALRGCHEAGEVMIIGGADCYAQALLRADRMYLTYIDHEFTGDQYFPLFEEEQWRETEREEHEADEKNGYSYTFVTLHKRIGSVP